MSFKITLTNRMHDGELDCRVVDTEEEINSAVQDIALNCVFSSGDRIVIDESE
jgi:hypothetical protein